MNAFKVQFVSETCSRYSLICVSEPFHVEDKTNYFNFIGSLYFYYVYLQYVELLPINKSKFKPFVSINNHKYVLKCHSHSHTHKLAKYFSSPLLNGSLVFFSP